MLLYLNKYLVYEIYLNVANLTQLILIYIFLIYSYIDNYAI